MKGLATRPLPQGLQAGLLLALLLLCGLVLWGAASHGEAWAQRAAGMRSGAGIEDLEETSPLAPEWRGVLKWTVVTSHAEPGEAGYLREGDDTRQRTELSLRLQVQGGGGSHIGYRIDYLNVARDLAPGDVQANEGANGAELFRYKPWRRELEGPQSPPGEAPSSQTFHWSHEIDHALLRVGGESWEAILGRQPISWGAGRFWSPTDLFAAFSPLALDTEFKPGVDALTLSAYPAPFAAVQAAWVASPADDPRTEDSAALRGRFQSGEVTEWTLVAATVRGEELAGGSVETSFLEAGWRLEGIAFRPPAPETPPAPHPVMTPPRQTYGYWVLGVDAQTGDGTVWVVEVYRNTLGASTEEDLPRVLTSTRMAEGRLPHLSATVAALAADREVGGLWRLGYAGFAAPLRDEAGMRRVSTLHRLALTYSVSDESEAVLALSGGSGRGLGPTGLPRSEFGHQPKTLHFSIQIVF